MNDRQLRFAQEYVIDYNATQAAIRAGYSPRSASSQGHALCKHPEVHAAIVKLGDITADELGLTRRRVLSKLWDTIERAADGVPRTDKNGDLIEIDGTRVLDWNPGAVIRGLEVLMKHRGDLVDQVDHSGSLVVEVNGVDVADLT